MSANGERLVGCHCLCAVNHRDIVGVCEGARATDLRFWVSASQRETVNVPMCSACVAATLVVRVGGQ